MSAEHSVYDMAKTKAFVSSRHHDEEIKNYWQAILVGIAAVAYFLAPAFRDAVSVQDEGFAVYGASRVLHGDVPYRDFLIEYPPGIFYLLAAVFKIFGTTLVVERLCDVSIRIIIALIIYVIARRLSSHLLGLASCASAVLLLGSCGFYGYAVFPAVAFSLSSALALMLFMEHGKPIWLLVSGSLTGLTAVFRHDFGLYTFVPAVFVLTLFCLSTPTRVSRSKAVASAWIYYVLGTALVVGPVLAFLAMTVPERDLWFDLIDYHITLDHKVSALPIPAAFPNLGTFIAEQRILTYLLMIKREWLPFYSSLLIYVSFLVLFTSAIFGMINRGARYTHRTWSGLLITLIGLLYYCQPWNRNDHIHRVPTLLISSIVLVVIVSKKDHLNTLVRVIVAALVIVNFLVNVYDPLLRWRRSVTRKVEPPCNLEKAPYLRCDIPNQREAVQFIAANVPPNAKIFVGNTQHAQICGYDLMFYFLADRRSGTKFANLLSGVTTRLEVQQQIIRDLNLNRVNWTVLYSGAQNCSEQNESQADSGVHLLDDFIREQFRFVVQHGNYQVWTRDDKVGIAKDWGSP